MVKMNIKNSMRIKLKHWRKYKKLALKIVNFLTK